jgi:hypothetical protein
MTEQDLLPLVGGGTGTVVTDYAVNIVLVAKIKGFILPAITGMALCAHAFIAT